jgi:hypothetical protein|tara:strand:+ start:1554 stop:1718 length:165 start_codon:yes stop_codon:yes gene_type:complete
MKQPEKQIDTQNLENEILGLCAFTDHPPLHGLSKLKELDIQICHEDWRVLSELN